MAAALWALTILFSTGLCCVAGMLVQLGLETGWFGREPRRGRRRANRKRAGTG